MPPIKRFQSKLIIAITEETRFAVEQVAISRGVTVSDVARTLIDSALESKGLLIS